jgi:hypothetical protein
MCNQSGRYPGKLGGEFGSLAYVKRYITILHLGLESVPIHSPLRRHRMERFLTSLDFGQTLNQFIAFKIEYLVGTLARQNLP